MTMNAVNNKRRYAEYWGYALVAPAGYQVQEYAAGFPIAWAKLAVVQEALLAHDFVFLLVRLVSQMYYDEDGHQVRGSYAFCCCC